MEDFEKLGVFYLGREYDLANKARKEDLLLYDSKDLVTHAVCVGMTGSGKTGLCIGLLEEAAIDGIPSIVIDPKGDLSNLLLQFPDLRAEDFAPWINQDDARNKGMSPEQYAQQQADLWKKGLALWNEDGERIGRLKASAEFAIYTPGSNAGLPVSILKSFAAPDRRIVEDNELLRERITATSTGLLGLLGMEANPLQSREHILLSTIFDTAWRQGQDLDLAKLIQQVQTPPVNRIGVLDLETFYPAKERFAFAMTINNLLAAPGFDLWLQGEALDVGRLLYTPQGKPRVSVFSIAHLNDSERMFFVSLFLTQILAWVRTQPGTSSLRAIVYMDEIFGYFPPVANPPSKAPLLTLLKQARAFGVGIVLATQNPVDLDYKGLANAGTWFIGRLQTERDKARLLDGLEGVSAGALDRQKMDSILSSLSSRVFLLNNVHEEEPVVFETRWALSYLRGPLTRNEIKDLMDRRRPASSNELEETRPGTRAVTASGIARETRPVLPPDVTQYFLPFRNAQPAGSVLLYSPRLLGCGKVFYADAKIGIAFEQPVALLTPFPRGTGVVVWDEAVDCPVADSDLEKFPAVEASYQELPSEAGNAKGYLVWTRSFSEWLYRNQTARLLKSEASQLVSRPGETERDFRIRLQQSSREQRDKLVERLRQKYAPKIASLQERIRRAEQAVDREQEQAKQQKLQTAISFGTTVLSALFGRKRLSTSTLGRATTAARGVSRTMKESEDIDRAQETVAVLQKQLSEMQEQLQLETNDVVRAVDPQTEVLQQVQISPKKSNVTVRLLTLVWTPYWQDAQGNLTQAW